MSETTGMQQPAPLIHLRSTISSLQTCHECASSHRVLLSGHHRKSPATRLPAIRIVSRSSAPSLLTKQVGQIAADQQQPQHHLEQPVKVEVTDEHTRNLPPADRPRAPTKHTRLKKPPLGQSRFKEVGIKRLQVFDRQCEGKTPTGFYNSGLKSLLRSRNKQKQSVQSEANPLLLPHYHQAATPIAIVATPQRLSEINQNA